MVPFGPLFVLAQAQGSAVVQEALAAATQRFRQIQRRLSGTSVEIRRTLDRVDRALQQYAVLPTTATRAVVSGARAIEPPVNVDSNSTSVMGTRLSRFSRRGCRHINATQEVVPMLEES